MKRGALRLYGLALLALAGASVVIFQQTPPPDGALAERVDEHLGRVRQMDAQTEQDMLALRLHLSSQYDDLTDDARALKRALADLRQDLAGMPEEAEPLAALAASIAVQTEAIEDFKSAVGVLNNSLRYLPTLARQLARAHPRLALLVNRYARDTLAWPNAPDDAELARRLNGEEAALSRAGLTALVRHSRLIRDYAARATSAIETAHDCGTPENAALVERAFNTVHAQRIALRQHMLTRLRWLTGLLVGGVLALLAALAWETRRLRQTHQILKRERAALASEREKLASIIDHASEAVLLTNEAGGIERANPAAERIFGYQGEEWRGLSVHDLAPEETRESHEAWLAETLAGERDILGQVRELTACRKDGAHVPVEVAVNAFRAGGQRKFSVIVRDIGERKKAMAEIEALAAAARAMGEGVMVTDTEARIEYVNPAFERLTGYPAAEAVGRFASILRGDAHDDDFYKQICRHLEAGETWRGRIVIRRKSGEDAVTERTITPVHDGRGNPVRHVTVMRDVTEELAEQRKREHAQRLESLGVLAGGIAHDFNNLLAAILGNASLGRMKLEAGEPAAIHLSRIEQASKQAAALCKQMLDYSGKGKMEVGPVHLSRMAEETLDLLRASISKRARLHLDLDPDLPLVQGDESQLRQVLMNLVINASEALGGQDGTIAIRTGPAGMAADDIERCQACHGAFELGEGPFVALEVEDDGCGMDEETLRRLFDPFFTTKFTGRGLGMSAVLGIVRGHGGAICVDSRPGAYSRFKVMLPCAESAASAPTDAGDVAGDAASGATVLVVDDEDMVREIAAEILQEAGLETLQARDGAEAVDIYREQGDAIDLVLLDVTMPNMDGRECLQALRRINPGVRVVLASGYSEETIERRFSGLRLDGIVKKPWAPEALIALVQRIAASRERLSRERMNE